MRRRVAVLKLISILYIIPKIWFGIYGNAGATSKKALHVHDLKKNYNIWKGVTAVCLVRIQYMHLEKIVEKAYHNKNGMDVLEDMRVVHKEEKFNRVVQLFIVLCHANFKATEL